MARLLVDTGFLVALGRRADPLHAAASDFFRHHAGPLLTVSPVVVETSFFLDARAKIHLLDLVRSERFNTLELPLAAYGDIAAIIGKYADRNIDFADAALVWAAERSGCRAILTVDLRDFGVYRLKGGKHFALMKWFD